MLKPDCEASRGHISHLSFDWAVHQRAGIDTSICHGIHRQAQRATALESSTLFRCVQSVCRCSARLCKGCGEFHRLLPCC